MALFEINWNPSRGECRRFGWAAVLILVPLALALMHFRNLPVVWAIALGATGAGIFLLSRISLKYIRLVQVGLTIATLPIGWCISHVMMGILYYGILTPIGLVFRLIGRDPLHRKWDPSAETYWLQRRKPNSIQQYFNQF